MSNARIASPASRLGTLTVALAIVAALGLSSACTQAASVKAMMTFKQANQAYQTGDYKRAVELYEQTIQNDPDMAQVYFFLGNSYDNLYKPGVTGDAANDATLNNAVKNYQIAAEKLKADDPAEAKLKKLSLEYLVAGYGRDKLNDPAKAEPVIQRIIQLDPGDPVNYFVLAKLYEDAGIYDEAEKVLLLAKQAKPNDSAVYMQLAGFYNRQGQFDKTIEALIARSQIEPNNPEAFYTIATYYWDEAYRDIRLKDDEKLAYVAKGMEAVEKALQIKPDYVEAIVYKGLLLRLQANLEKDSTKAQALLKQAEELSVKANELRKAKAAGVSE